MDTRTRTASPAADEDVRHATPPPVQDKISAYYSLVFPHYTFYIQTLSIAIGRRCGPNTASSSSVEQPQVDVDLGALKSVSRLHAKIEYDQEEDRFVLVVLGRNGAWVDGVWTCAGSRAPLGERSQIQIASRTFHFVLPPPPPPEDSPSPSSQSSAHRQRSPSVDITSISPPSSQLSHSPPILTAKLPSPPSPPLPPVRGKGKSIPKPPPLPTEPELPNSNSIGRSNKTNPKKRKKSDVDPPPLERPKPEDMPPKPPFTYAQLIYRAIKDMKNKATLQEICNWIMNNYEYYRYADGAWMSSVRHNLSSGRAFLKLERCGGDRGKGFFWTIDEQHARALEEHEQKAQEAAAAAAAGITLSAPEPPTKARKKDKSAPLDPPLKRSIKGESKGVPLPPPLTSAPLAFKVTPKPANVVKSEDTSVSHLPSGANPTGVFAYPGQATTSPNSPFTKPFAAATAWPTHSSVTAVQALPGATPTPPVTQTPTPTPALPLGAPLQVPAAAPAGATPAAGGVPDVVVPITLGPIPPGHPDYSAGHPNNSAKEGYMILHERKLILDPDVFSGLTQEMLVELQNMGARAALGVLAGHMVRALKERRARERSKGVRRPKGTSRKSGVAPGAPFTKVPLDEARQLQNGAAPSGTGSAGEMGGSAPAPADPGSPIIVVDDSEDEGPMSKRRRLDTADIVH